MSYPRYVARVERRRALLQAELQETNQLRRSARLPTRDIESELDRQCLLLTEEAWKARGQERKAFSRFRQDQLAGTVMPTSSDGTDWQAQRALVLRRAVLEHQIWQTWLTRPTAGTSQATPRQA